MIALKSLALALAITGSNEPVLLDFYADWCGPCRQMEPAVRRLIAEGMPVRKVNVDRERELAQQFRVEAVPTFVMVAGGSEVQRVVGPASYSQLKQIIQAAKPVSQTAAGSRVSQPYADRAAPATNASSRTATQTKALHATVRLKIDDPNGASFGTGTIVDVHGDEALIVTCGHIFRDSKGRGQILVDMFAPGTRGPLPGHLISYDLDRDIGFVSFRPSVDVTPMKIAGQGHPIRRGDTVFSVGCDRGNPPTVRNSQITAINKYAGHDNIESSGAPVIGRSGGGLFTADGQLIGICNLADPEDDEGIYAALSLVHARLDKIGQSRLYRTADAQLASHHTPAANGNPREIIPPKMAKAMPRPTPAESLPPTATAAGGNGSGNSLGRLATLLREASDDTEVICIVRSKNDPQRRSEVIVLDRSSHDTISTLARGSNRSNSSAPIVLQASRSGTPGSQPPQRSESSGPIMRGQSLR